MCADDAIVFFGTNASPTHTPLPSTVLCFRIFPDELCTFLYGCTCLPLPAEDAAPLLRLAWLAGHRRWSTPTTPATRNRFRFTPRSYTHSFAIECLVLPHFSIPIDGIFSLADGAFATSAHIFQSKSIRYTLGWYVGIFFFFECFSKKNCVVILLLQRNLSLVK